VAIAAKAKEQNKKNAMKTTNEILKEIENLQEFSKNLQAEAVLGLLADLTRVVESIRESIPREASQKEVNEILDD
jgi:hypothetical protein